MKPSILLLGAAFLFSCNPGDTDTDKAEVTEVQQPAATAGGNNFTVDTTQSTVTWTGYKPGGQHTGVFPISQGTITGDSSGISSGSFTINVAGIRDKDLSGADKDKLEGHLRSADFFEVEKYPTARFEITGVQPYSDTSKTKSLQGATHLVSGNLTLKDQTQNISFPAKISANAGQVTANADFDIDRTQWGMNYKGPKNPTNWFIAKNVNIKLNIVAKK